MRALIGLLAVTLVVGGLLLFTHSQTQPLFQTAEEADPTSTQAPRSDGGMLMGAFLSATGLTLLVALLSPLRRQDRVIPALLLAAVTMAVMAAHFSIFTNGLTFTDQKAVAMQSTVLFHDTAATISIATFALALMTGFVLLIGALALMVLIAPRILHEHVLKPRTLNGHRTRMLMLTLLLLAAGATFARQFIAFGLTTGPDPLRVVYLLMATILGVILVMVTWRSCRFLWGRLAPKTTASFRRKHQGALRVESGLWALLLAFTVATFFAEPIYEPSAGTDPVFAVNSIGVSWVFLLVFVVYLLQRATAQSYHRLLATHQRPLPNMRPDRLFAFAVIAILLWTLGALWALHPALNPLGVLAARLLPIVILLPFFALRTAPLTGNEPWTAQASPVMLLGWATLSILTGIMFWGIGNSVMVVYSSAAGLINTQGRLFDPASAGARLLGSLLILAPGLLALWLFGKRHARPGPTGLLAITGAAGLIALHTLFTIDPVLRYNPGVGHTDVLVGFWAASLPTGSVVMMSALIALSTMIGLTAGVKHLHRNVDKRSTALPWTGRWKLSLGTSKRYGQPISAARRLPEPTHGDQVVKRAYDSPGHSNLPTKSS